MQKYIEQLLSDIETASENLNLPFVEAEGDYGYFITDEEEEVTAPVRNLQDWTGINGEMLPPATRLNNNQIILLLDSLKRLLATCNWNYVLQTQVPEEVQYENIRRNFNQEAKIKQWHHGFFEMCKQGTPHYSCSLGQYCQCAFYAELFADCIPDDRTPEEQRASELEIEIAHLKKKYDDEWMKYYPYHLDVAYDDDEGNPYNYGIEDDGVDEEDNWWRK